MLEHFYYLDDMNAPSDLTQISLTENEILLSWKAQTNIDNVDHYILSYELRGSTMEIVIPGCLSSYKLKHPDDDYTLTLSACTDSCCNENGTYLTVKAPIRRKRQTNIKFSLCKLIRNETSAPTYTLHLL